jgi:hypothetical protein
MNIVVFGKELSQQKNEPTMIIFDSIMVATELPSETTGENKGNLHVCDLEGFGQDFPMFLLVLHSTSLKGDFPDVPAVCHEFGFQLRLWLKRWDWVVFKPIQFNAMQGIPAVAGQLWEEVGQLSTDTSMPERRQPFPNQRKPHQPLSFLSSICRLFHTPVKSDNC